MMMMMMMMMMIMMMMRCNQGFRVQTIFQKRKQFEYHRLIPLQNVPTLDAPGTLVLPV